MYNGRIFGTTETFSSTTDFFGKSCLTMMMSVTECFICIDSLAFPQKGDAASKFFQENVSNDPENSLEPESDKLVDNYYFRCLP